MAKLFLACIKYIFGNTVHPKKIGYKQKKIFDLCFSEWLQTLL